MSKSLEIRIATSEKKGTAHIALFLHALRGGGAERVMLALACGFEARGFEVDLVLAHADGPYLRDVPDSIRLIDLKSGRVLTSLPALIRYLRHAKPDALLAAQSHVNVVAILARTFARIPTRLIVTVHTVLSVATANAPSLKSRLTPWFMRHSFPRADRVVAVSNGVADDLATTIGLARSQIETIYNPVVTPLLLSRFEEPLNHPWFAQGEPPVVLGVGRLTVAKGFSNLIKAFAILRKKRVARLLILGEGELRPNLERLVGDLEIDQDVSLPGFVDNPYQYMRQASVFVLSSRWEGLPTVLIEAMACGTPVISTNCPGGSAEILEDGRWGPTVPAENPEALAIAIAGVISGPTHTGVSKRALDFSLDVAVDRYLQVLGTTP